MPYPPAYAEIYPVVPQTDVTNMGWQQQPPPEDTTPINQATVIHPLPPAYGTAAMQQQGWEKFLYCEMIYLNI